MLQKIKFYCSALLLAAAMAQTSIAGPGEVSYSGRLVQSDGRPLVGQVDLTLKFYDDATDPTPVLIKSIPDVVLAQGVFTVALPLNDADRTLVFANANGAWIEVSAAGKVYPRQAFTAVPYALKLVGPQSLLNFDAPFPVSLTADPATSEIVNFVLPPDGGAPGQVIKTDGDGNLYWDAPASGTGNMDGINNLSELTDASVARTNLGLGNASVKSVGTTGSDVAAGDHSHSAATGAAAGFMSSADKSKLDGVEVGADVTDTANVDAAGALMNSDFGSNGILRRTGAGTYDVLTDNSTNWNNAFTDRLKWDGGATGLVAATARTSLNLVPGTDVQAQDPGLQSIAGLTTVADQMIYTTAADTYATTGLTSFGRALLDDASVAAQQATLGLGSMAVQASGSVAITGGTITGVTFSTPAFANDAISGDKVHGGTISNFASTGIDDNASATAMTIDSSGNVGVGTAAPAYILDIAQNVNGVARVNFHNSNAGTTAKAQIDAKNDVGSTVQVGVTSSGFTPSGASLADEAFIHSNGSAALRVGTVTAQPIRFSPANTERMRIDAAGNVGIGTTSPTEKLHVAGGSLALDNNGKAIGFRNAANTGWAGYFDSDASNNTMWHYNNSGSVALTVLNSNGNVGIGTTAPGAPLEVNGQVKITGGTPGAGKVLTSDASGLASWTTIASSGKVAQMVHTSLNTYLLCNSAIPDDDTLPQIGEGTEVFNTSITPTNAGSTLVIDAVVHLTEPSNSGNQGTIALFQDGGANAIAAAATNLEAAASLGLNQVVLRHVMTAGSTAAKTFSIRAGNDAGNLNVNGKSNARILGGALISRLTITEYLP